MKKYLFKTALWTLALGVFASCSEDDNIPEIPEVPVITTGAYILNTGNWGENNATIQWYDLALGNVSTDLFQTANGSGIGDAQDMCVYGSKIYITSTTSSKIEIVNRKDFKIMKTLLLRNEANKPLEPRYLAATEGNVYFTAYDGTVSRLDTLSMAVTAKIEVGNHPEALTSANGKLYVNVSGYGLGNKVAVIDVKTFKKTKDLDVLLNPYDECITAADGNVYFVSCGDFTGNPKSTLQCIDSHTDVVTEICSASKIANKGDKMYIIYGEYYLTPETKSISVYDLKTKENKTFADYSSFQNPSVIEVDPVSGDVYIIDAPYSVTNNISIYTADGTFKKKIDSGYYTTKVSFITQ